MVTHTNKVYTIEGEGERQFVCVGIDNLTKMMIMRSLDQDEKVVKCTELQLKEVNSLNG